MYTFNGKHYIKDSRTPKLTHVDVQEAFGSIDSMKLSR